MLNDLSYQKTVLKATSSSAVVEINSLESVLEYNVKYFHVPTDFLALIHQYFSHLDVSPLDSGRRVHERVRLARDIFGHKVDLQVP
jgi:hypothetical protein